MDRSEAEVEPPDQEGRNEYVGRPYGMDPVDSFADPRVQDQRDAAEEVNDGEAKYHGDEDGQILVWIHDHLGPGVAVLGETHASNRAVCH